MTKQTPAAMNDIEAATTARWLTRALQPARAEAMAGPSAEAIDRIRARVFGEPTTKKRFKTLAA